MQMTLICYVCHQIIVFMQNRIEIIIKKYNHTRNTKIYVIQTYIYIHELCWGESFTKKIRRLQRQYPKINITTTIMDMTWKSVMI